MSVAPPPLSSRALIVALRVTAILIAVLGMIDPAITLDRPQRQPLTIAVQHDSAPARGGERGTTETPRQDMPTTPVITAYQDAARAGDVRRHGNIADQQSYAAGQQAMASALVLQQLLSAEYDVRVRDVVPPSRGPVAGLPAARAAACETGVPCILVGGDRWTAPVTGGRSQVVGAVHVGDADTPRVEIAGAVVPTAVHRSAVGRLDVQLSGHGVSGQRSTIEVLDGGVPVGHAAHEWTDDGDATVGVDWWPIDSGVRRLTVRAARTAGRPGNDGASADAAAAPDRDVEDDRLDVGAIVETEPYRVLVYDARPSWTSTFVRRAIEKDSRLSVRLLARLGPQLQVSAGEPFRLDEAALADASAVVIGALDGLTARDVDALETYVRVRGGTLILVPDRKPTGPATRLFGLAPGRPAPQVPMERLEPSPVRVGDWRASELLVFRNLPAGATALARVAGAAADAVVVSIPSGNGRVVVSGAMDAWRYRDAPPTSEASPRGAEGASPGGAEGAEPTSEASPRSAEGASPVPAFDRAWQSLVADAAAAGGRPLEVALDRAVVRPADDVRVTVRLRSMRPLDTAVAVSASLVCEDAPDARVAGDPSDDTREHANPAGRGERVVRLWPTGDRRVFEGRVAVPRGTGACRVAATTSVPVVASATADLLIRDRAETAIAAGETASDVRETAIGARETASSGTLARLVRIFGARVVVPGDEATLAGDVRRLVPVRTAATAVRPMRSPWWIVPFAACLGLEWWLRRRRGLR